MQHELGISWCQVGGVGQCSHPRCSFHAAGEWENHCHPCSQRARGYLHWPTRRPAAFIPFISAGLSVSISS